MTKIMSATEMTDGQIENAVSKLRDAIRKHRSKITSDVAQKVLGVENLGMMMFAPFRDCVESFSDFIVRKVTVNCNLSPREALKATGRTLYINDDVVENMPKGIGDETEVVFFKLDLSKRSGRISNDDLIKEYELRGLVPVDPYTLAKVNEDAPAFADEHPNGTQWKDANGQWSFATFHRWNGARGVGVGYCGYCWDGFWCFGGVRK